MGIIKIIVVLTLINFSTDVSATNHLIIFNQEWWGKVSTEYLENALNQGLDPNSKDKNGFTLMHYASFSKSTEILKLLINYGGDMDAQKNKLAQTPLHWAANYGSEKYIKLLIDMGVNIIAKDSLDRSLCYYLKRNNKLSKNFTNCYC